MMKIGNIEYMCYSRIDDHMVYFECRNINDYDRLFDIITIDQISFTIHVLIRLEQIENAHRNKRRDV